MATIQQLLQSQKQGRVQVGDLPDAPGLQPTIRSGGQYTVRTQQAPESKLSKLAKGLSHINPALRDYAATQEIEAEMYEADLKSLTPQELKAKLNQSEKALDKEVRKGKIPFLGSPLNWRRKKRALGAAMHDDFEHALANRFNNPEEGDDDKNAHSIINLVQQDYVKDVGMSPLIAEGFQEAINPTIKRYALNYDAQKSRETKVKVARESANSIYRIFKDIDALDSAQYDIDALPAAASWEALNAFSPDVQLAVISSIAKSLARVDEIKAKKFLQWAETSVKVGNAYYGKNDIHVEELERVIDKIALEEETTDAAERAKEVERKSASFRIDLNTLQQYGVIEKFGQTFMKDETGVFLERYVEEAGKNDDPVAGAAMQKAFEEIVKSDITTDDRGRIVAATTRFDEAKTEEVRGLSIGYKSFPSNMANKIESMLRTESTVRVDEDGPVDPVATARAINASRLSVDAATLALVGEFTKEVDQRLKRLMKADPNATPDDLADALDDYIQEQLPGLNVEIEKSMTRILEKEKERGEALQQMEKDFEEFAKGVEAITWTPATSLFSREATPSLTLRAVRHNQRVLANPAAKEDQKQAAWDYNAKWNALILTDLTKRSRSVNASEKLEATKDYFEFVKLDHNKLANAVLTAARLKADAAAGKVIVPDASRLLKAFTEDGFEFNKGTYPNRVAILLQRDYAENPKDHKEDIKKIGDWLGIETDAELKTFIERQKTLHDTFFHSPQIVKIQ